MPVLLVSKEGALSKEGAFSAVLQLAKADAVTTRRNSFNLILAFNLYGPLIQSDADSASLSL